MAAMTATTSTYVDVLSTADLALLAAVVAVFAADCAPVAAVTAWPTEVESADMELVNPFTPDEMLFTVLVSDVRPDWRVPTLVDKVPRLFEIPVTDDWSPVTPLEIEVRLAAVLVPRAATALDNAVMLVDTEASAELEAKVESTVKLV